MMKRRSFLALIGASPIAAKAAIDARTTDDMGMWNANGLGDASMRLSAAGLPCAENEAYVPYESRLIGAADYLKAFGLPEVIQVELREQAKFVSALDPDIACKVSWSMSVKIMTQRQRNYDRAVERIKISGWQQRKKSALKAILGFEWPF